jgi:FemAB-related protein (PEP-CTERM system-associated)
MSETEVITLPPNAWPLAGSAGLNQKNKLPPLPAHLPSWIECLKSGLKHRGYVIRAVDEGNKVGELPLMLVSGPIFGKFLCSLPYINTGGAWAKNDEIGKALIDKACELADSLNVRYLELRHEQPFPHPKLNFERSDKVHMRLSLSENDEELDRGFKSKLRSQVRKSGSHDHVVKWGNHDLLNKFYAVFSTNMRDLGTPVFPRALFGSILTEFGPDAELCLVENGAKPIAGALLVHSNGTTEVPSASSLRAWNPTGANMFMYRQLLSRAIQRGSHTFDFGRSSVDTGTYKFKAQWGAKPHPAVWQYYIRKGSADDMRPDSDRNQKLIKIWQKLPVWLTRVIGPPIVRGIP